MTKIINFRNLKSKKLLKNVYFINRLKIINLLENKSKKIVE